MHALLRPALFAAALALGACGHAATVTVTPETAQATLQNAHDGDTITLAPGDYPQIGVRGKTWSPGVTVDAKAARLVGVRFDRVSGLTWRGGRFDGGNTAPNGFKVQIGDHVAVEDATMSGYLRNGIGFDRVSDGRIAGNTINGSGADGIDIALSRRIVVDHNKCLGNAPTPGAHPDCIQMWSRPTDPPTADITITNNYVNGNTQGITGFDGIHKEVADGGFDRIRIEDNIVEVGMWHGVTLYNCRDCVVRRNKVSTLPNGRIKAWIKFTNSDVLACGNAVESFPDSEPTRRCKK